MALQVDASRMRLICTCARGTEKALKFEMKACGVEKPQSLNGAVHGYGSAEAVAQLNVSSRIAHRVLWEVYRFSASDESELYDGLRAFPIEDYWKRGWTLATKAHLNQAPMTHDKYVTLRVKDALVDRLREKTRMTPVLAPQGPDLLFVLYWDKNEAILSLDTSGHPLHQRGYRPRGAIAPMRETLAASILAIGHADVTRPFLDPCCGSGTLAIEQAYRALRRAPGKNRRFAGEKWGADTLGLKTLFERARERAADEELSQLPAPIYLSDWHPKAVALATEAIASAKLEKVIQVERRDARKVQLAEERPVICSNLPFGERMAQNTLQLDGFYRTLGEVCSQFPGVRILFLTTHPYAEKLLNLGRPKKWPLYSGQLSAKLRKWDLE
jgi:23S rRNA G2445 N2-methylase RlmL